MIDPSGDTESGNREKSFDSFQGFTALFVRLTHFPLDHKKEKCVPDGSVFWWDLIQNASSSTAE
ncbi:MAG: hypothetical protein ACYCTV_08760 [Leptospirales bacterium]